VEISTPLGHITITVDTSAQACPVTLQTYWIAHKDLRVDLTRRDPQPID